jgi:hypothetical protein
MDGTLNLTQNVLAYGDVGKTSNPAKKYVDWSVQRSYTVANPKSDPYTVDPGSALTLFSGTRAVSVDNTTEFTLTLSPLAADRYRFAWTGVGTAPGFHTDRALTPNGHTFTLTANSNLTLTMASSTVGEFAAVQVGDVVYLPGISTGDAATPFSELNTGSWSVLAKDGTSTTLTLARPSQAAFVGASEVVLCNANTRIQAWAVAGVQVGDKVTISAGFPASVQNTYTVVAVTSKAFEVIATQPLPAATTAVPTATGIVFYTGAKRYVRFEADQECVVRLNGDTGNTNRMSPWEAGDPDQTAFFEKVGPCWSAVVVNLSSSPLNFLFISAE